MEALALGRPVISTYVAGIPELVEPGVCGWLVPPGSVEALKVAIVAALASPTEKLEAMGKTGALRVAQQHNANVEASKLAVLFRSISELLPSQVASNLSVGNVSYTGSIRSGTTEYLDVFFEKPFLCYGCFLALLMLELRWQSGGYNTYFD